MDGTYFAKFCLVAYQDNFDGYTQLIRFTDGEHFEEVKEDLTNLLLLGVKLESITSDGDKSVLKAIKKTDENIIIQRCLVHIQRMRLIWLTKFPKHLAGQELRKHDLILLKIKTPNYEAWRFHYLLYSFKYLSKIDNALSSNNILISLVKLTSS